MSRKCLRTTTKTLQPSRMQIASPASAFTGARPMNSPWSPARKIFLFQVTLRTLFKNCATPEDTLAWSIARQSNSIRRSHVEHPRIPEWLSRSGVYYVTPTYGIRKCLVKPILAMTKQLVFRDCSCIDIYYGCAWFGGLVITPALVQRSSPEPQICLVIDEI